jgi:serine/threonine protein kinase
VPYIIFEAADQDVRKTLSECDVSEQLARLSLAHHAAVALNQLHTNSVTHRDIKPSNMVVWIDRKAQPSSADHLYEGKLADLGCAHMPNRPSPHDGNPIAGAIFYAAPEQLYECPKMLINRRRREAADMFMLGNLIVFLMVGVTYNELIYNEIDDSLHWRNWGGSYDEALPGLVNAHVSALEFLETILLESVTDLVGVIGQLCHPDPERRGDDIARRQKQSPYQLQRFVTRLDFIQRRAPLFRRAS